MGTKDSQVTFENKVLEKIILEVVKKNRKGLKKWFLKGITKEELEGLTSLSLNFMELDNLDFLKYLPSLKDLELDGIKGLRDISGVSGCNQLSCFYCSDTPVDDFTPLLSCRKLEKVDYMCELEEKSNAKRSERELAVLGKLSQIKELDFFGNQISDVSFLAECNTLEKLTLSGNPLCTIAPLKRLPSLEYLEIAECGLKELENLEQFPVLKYVYAEGNSIPDSKQEEYRKNCAHIEELEF